MAPVRPPGFHVYEVAPDPVRVALDPEQMEGEEADADTVGIGTTVNEELVLDVQVPLLPIIV